MPNPKGTKWRLQAILNTLLLVCLAYLGLSWLFSPGKPELDQVVLNHLLGNGNSIYGVRDSGGGATVGFSYRYYVHPDFSDERAILTGLVSKSPFLKTREPTVEVMPDQDGIRLVVRGRVYEYSSFALENLGALNVRMTFYPASKTD